MDFFNDKSGSTFFTNLLDIIPVFVYWKNADGLLLGCNQMQANVLGYENKQHIVGKTDYDFYEKEKADEIHCNDRLILRDKMVLKQEERVENYHGEEYTVLSIKCPIVLIDGSLGIAGVSVDISDLKKSQHELIHAKNAAELSAKIAAEVAAEEKSAFMANMRHDFRTPLGNITSSISLLSEPDLLSSEDFSFCIAGIEKEANKLQQLIESVVDFTRIKSQDFELIFNEFDLRVVTETVIDTLASKAKEKNIILSLDYPDTEVCNVIGDTPCVTRIILNVIDNAIKFTQQGSVHVSVSGVEQEFSNSNKVMLSLKIEDSGVGMSEAELGTVFDEFTRLQPAYTGEHVGLGLGLPTVKFYTELLGGELDIHSKVGQGTCVIINLPFQRISMQSVLSKWQTEEAYQQLNIILLSDNVFESQVLQKQTHCQIIPSHSFLKSIFELLQSDTSLDILIVDDNITAVDYREIPAMLRTLGHQMPLLLFLTENLTIEKFEIHKALGYSGYFKRPIHPSKILPKLTEYWESVTTSELK